MRELGMTPSDAELQDMINEVDADGNGDIDLPEFINLMSRRRNQMNPQDELVGAFNLFSGAHKSHIRKEDLKSVMAILGEEADDDEVEEMMNIIDDDSNQGITFSEFEVAWNKLCEER
eukprot:Macronucleus_8500.p1 GENE.Macronucleus_8500~~Macronucleus_8500.p1  ORF type:complete len:118 (+),score=36.43 Macronucleus_8500:1-354(+)